MLENYPQSGAQPAAAPPDTAERLYRFVCHRCGHRFSVLYQQLRNPNLPYDTPCPICGNLHCQREAAPGDGQPADD
jgi:hypothetical protein